MKKHCVRILSVFFGLAALAIAAKGQTVDQIVVNIPYEFVVAGKKRLELSESALFSQ